MRPLIRGNLYRRLANVETHLNEQNRPDTHAMVCALGAWVRERPEVHQELLSLAEPASTLESEAMRSRGISFREAEQLPEVRAALVPWLQRSAHYARLAGMHRFAELLDREYRDQVATGKRKRP